MGIQKWHIVAVLVAGLALTGCPKRSEPATEDIAQEWMNLTRDALLVVNIGPPPEARVLWHVSIAMYDSWAAYDATANAYLAGDALRQPASQRNLANQAETLSHAVHGVLLARMPRLGSQGSDGRLAARAIREKMQLHGYLDARGQVVESDAQALGAQIAQMLIEHFEDDNSNEENGYADTTGYTPVNPPIISNDAGTNGAIDPNRWQEIVTPDGAQQTFLGAHWRHVTPFALPPYTEGALRYDPGPPPQFGTESEQEFIDEMVEVIRVIASSDPTVGLGAEMVNLSPRIRGIETPFIPSDARGHPINPATNQPYADHFVRKGDYVRANAMYHDGETFQTPVPWWNEVITYVLSGTGIVSDTPANKPQDGDLGYDVRLYFAAQGAMHDAGIVVREIKRDTDTSRPITGIRALAELGRLPIIEDLIERIGEDDPLAGPNGEYVGEYKVMAWVGPSQGVDWIRALEWHPYQGLDFVSPPFPGYNSGHATYSRAGAEVLELFTGDPYFPGGLAELVIEELRFEDNLSGPVHMQSATYVDMADEVAFARVCTGVHIYADVVTARPIGADIAQHAFDLATLYFEGNAQGVAKHLLP